MHWLLVCSVLFAARADARTVIGYRNGEKLRVELADVAGTQLEIHTAVAFRAMAKAASRAGFDLRIRNGFRSLVKQAELYRSYRKGTGNLAAAPGYSNHQSGRALDLYITDYKVYEWLIKHAATFGFHRTVRSEPWHWEYLGGYMPAKKRGK
jgi:LAS superfamily LD-carboxypeptidase LdcB